MLYIIVLCVVLVGALVGKNIYQDRAEAQRVEQQRLARFRRISEGMRGGQTGMPLRDFAVSQDAGSAVGLSEDGLTLVLLQASWPTIDDSDAAGEPAVDLRTLASHQLLGASVRTREASVVDKKGRVADKGNQTVDLVVYVQDLTHPVVRVRFMSAGSGDAEAFEKAIEDAVHWEGMVRALASMVDHTRSASSLRQGSVDGLPAKAAPTDEVRREELGRRLRAREEAERLMQQRGLSLPRG